MLQIDLKVYNRPVNKLKNSKSVVFMGFEIFWIDKFCKSIKAIYF
jgi:hypothetical protein